LTRNLAIRFDDIKDEIAESFKFYIPFSEGAEFISFDFLVMLIFDFLVMLIFDLWLIRLDSCPCI
jgi:hypothetical protein